MRVQFLSMAVCALPAIVGNPGNGSSANVPAAHITTTNLETAISAVTKKRSKPRSVRQRQEGQIACTVSGCQRIPPECHPETEYNWDGIPTGFDAIVCRPLRIPRG
ncbi:MAG TPA: hypothetical protein VFP60_11360 [Pseudolabrys sp.]|nr:hypothetical protein [Pseudolabrys sp.]